MPWGPMPVLKPGFLILRGIRLAARDFRPPTTSIIITTTLVNVYDGKYVAHVYDSGTDNGFYYTSGAITNGVTPGSVWKAAGARLYHLIV